MGIGHNLKMILAERKISVKKLSEMSGVPDNTLYSIIKKDDTGIMPETRERIKKALGIKDCQLDGGMIMEIELGKVIKGLECCTSGRGKNCCIGCPYIEIPVGAPDDYDGCDQLMKDALEAVRELDRVRAGR